MAKTTGNFYNPQGAHSVRNNSGSASRAKNSNLMMKTTQNFQLSNKKQVSTTTAKVLPPKLPPRAAMSPAMNASVKSKNLLGSNNKTLVTSQHAPLVASKASLVDTPVKDNIYFAHN